jgi:phage-related baseplate assembly protein
VTINSSAIDLSKLAAPEVVETLSFDTIYAAMLTDMITRCQAAGIDFDVTLDSEPVAMVLQAAAYRELLIRQRVNEAAKSVMIAYATGADLDQLGALMDVARLTITAATDTTAAVMEADDDYRARIVLAPESFSVAGPELAYVYWAKTASASVSDASATSPNPGEVVVSVLSVDGDGTAPADMIAAVEALVNSDPVRPLTDAVTVQSATIVNFTLAATIFTFTGPDASVVVASAQSQLVAYLANSRLLGRDITISGLHAALTVEGVQRAVLTSPTADVVCDPTEAAHCTSITVVHGGYAN